MRHILRLYGAEVRGALARARGPRGRIEAIILASFAAPNFKAEVISAWLNFYVQAEVGAEAYRLLVVYQRRLRSNLVVGLRPLLGSGAPDAAEILAALIDGFYIRAALGSEVPDGARATSLTLAALDRLLAGPDARPPKEV
jgi:TetR/AcrR family transcriptional repressor of bet genes